MSTDTDALCQLDEIEEPGSLGFYFEASSPEEDFFVIRRDNQVYGYYNRCPHIGAPLDWSPDRFLDPDGALIQCAMHGALFAIETGECVHGPCVGTYLTPRRVQVVNGLIKKLSE